ncbi:ABC transporter ATP-binding protein [Uliginosibacterium aquaticum]|uniref:ABC transporter ATP-binding protein n=1 Tax=Uliginosibacterium aquaticum TaxID=2731212 RepID=A0ABX2ID89_9RHOO|nr:ABC transporter ATP-binding protein [Uliginosibacterium aquaticum]NSL54541.1 ABC transporter ATP-binding protein [Uliginosibacterium aquaticum]
MSGLTIHALDAGYRKHRVIHALDLPTLAPGSLLALVGANAAGKSTLLRTLAGLLPAQGGRATLGEANLLSLDALERRRLLGYLPQSLPSAASLYAWETVQAALRATRPGISRREADRLGEQLFERLGLQALAMQRMNVLSGGQRQMVGLAQLIVREPQLLLLDEPTSALDPRWQLELLGAVREMARSHGLIAVLALHDLNLALRFCDRVLVLGEGRVLAEGRPAEFMTPGVLRAAYGVEGRVETCSQGATVVYIDRACPNPSFGAIA